jgi:hypothetical protein
MSSAEDEQPPTSTATEAVVADADADTETAQTSEGDETKAELLKKKEESEELTKQLQKLALERQKVSVLLIHV